jgi:hypothetical protein
MMVINQLFNYSITRISSRGYMKPVGAKTLGFLKMMGETKWNSLIERGK